MTGSSRETQPTSARVARPKKPSFDALIGEQLRDPEFRAVWAAMESKRRIVSALLRLRAEANLTQKELAEKAGWSPAFVSRLESFPRAGERLYMPDLATLETYARACGFEFGLVFGRPKGRGARVAVATTAAFGESKGFRRALAALVGTEILLARGEAPRLVLQEDRQRPTAGRARRR